MLESYSDVLTVQDVMTILHIGRSKAYELLRTNEIPSMKIGKSTLFPSTY